MSVKKISKEQPEKFEFNATNNEIAKKICIGKLNKFKEVLRGQIKSDPNRKILIFSEFADTADYLFTSLNKEFKVFKYTSADSSEKRRDIIKENFDASNNNKKDDFDILVATDAIAEGFNLNRAGTIFNYDIPYNPTKVIQRIGRINRINKNTSTKNSRNTLYSCRKFG